MQGDVEDRARILVVDGDPRSLRQVSALLEQAGHLVRAASSGEEALALAGEQRPDLVLLDVALPDLDGLEACRRIKANPELVDVPVVLLSGPDAWATMGAEGLEAGAEETIVRPCSDQAFLARVGTVLRLQRAQVALRERTRALGERVKELNCLYGLSALVDTPGISLEAILQGTVDLIPPALQYPEVACARLLFEDTTFQTENYQKPPWRVASTIAVRGRQAGRLQAGYLEPRPEADVGPFLTEERAMLEALCERLGRVVERIRAEEALRRTHDDLERLVEARTAELSRAMAVMEREVNERLQAVRDLQRSNRALKVLSGGARAVAQAGEEAELLERTCRIAVEEGGYVLAWIGYAQQDEGKTVSPVAQAGFEDGYLETAEITWADTERGRGPTGRAIRSGQPAAARDILRDPRFAPWRKGAIRRGYASSLALPLSVRGRVLGALNIYAAEADAFDEEEVRLLSELAENLAYGVHALRVRAERELARQELEETAKELARSNAFLSALSQMSVQIQTTTEPDGVLEALGAGLQEMGLTCTVALLDAGGEELVIHTISVPAESQARFQAGIGSPLAGHRLPAERWPGRGVIADRRAVYVPARMSVATEIAHHASEARISRALQLLGLPAQEPVIHLPLATEEQVIGALSVSGAGLKEADVPVLSVLASQVAVAFERARLGREAAEVEILREVDRLRSELVANVSHEIRTPLGLIEIAATSLLMEDVELDPGTQRQLLVGIKEETDRLKAIVDNLLNLARMESGRFRLEVRPTDLSLLVREVARAMEPQLEGRRLACQLLAAPLVVPADGRQIEQVLRNLLANAIRYSPEGTRIGIEAASEEGQVTVCVRDEGVGIPLEEQERIFERFYRVQSDPGGVGLGLAVCRGIVEAHGGRIWVESAPGEGSRFCFTLPLDQAWE